MIQNQKNKKQNKAQPKTTKTRCYFKINFNIFIPSNTVFQSNESAHFHCPKCSLTNNIKWKAGSRLFDIRKCPSKTSF